MLLYVKNLTLREIGEILGVSESRVCQIHGQLKKMLREQLDADALLFARSPEAVPTGHRFCAKAPLPSGAFVRSGANCLRSAALRWRRCAALSSITEGKRTRRRR